MCKSIPSISHKRISGFSSLEMMVAIGILATIFILAMPFFSQQGKIVKQLRTSANCQAILDTAFSRINSFGNSLDGYQANLNPAFTAGITGTAAATQLAFQAPMSQMVNTYDPDFQAQRASTFNIEPNIQLYRANPGKTVQIPNGASTVGVPIAQDGVTLYTPLLLKGSMEYLATKYNVGHCNAFAPVKLLTSADTQALNSLYTGGFRNLSLNLKVARYDLGTNQLASYSCGPFWPRPRNGARTNVTYEPQFGTGAGRQIIGSYPNWISDRDGFRVTMRAAYTNDQGQTEDCEGTKDFSLPDDRQNVVDYFYDVNYVKASAVNTAQMVDNYTAMRVGTRCNGASCLGHPFETVLTNLQPYSASNPNWPENRDRPLCSQTASNNMDLVVTLRVYNYQKEPGVVPMCMDTSNQWFRNSPGNWCPGSYNGGAETSFDKSWNMRYTGWVPCEQIRFCNSRPDRVEVIRAAATNSKFTGAGVSQPYLEYKYYFNGINGDRNNPRMWGCEMKFGVAMLDMAGNLSYVPALEAMMAAATLVPGDKRPPIKEINPHVYFKPPPCYTCNCKPCKGGKGLFGGLFNWVLFVVLVVVSGGLFGVIVAAVVAAICLGGGLGCYSGGGTNFVPNSAGGKYRSCNDSNNGCKCGQKCNAIRPPGPAWSAPLDESMDISKIEDNACKPGSTFYNGGTAYNNVGGMIPTLAYKTPKGGMPGNGYEYLTNPDIHKIQPGDEVMWAAFDPPNKRFCYVAARCVQGKLQVIKESSDVPGDNNLYPLMGCHPTKVGRKISFTGSQYGIAQGADPCLEVQFQGGPQNPSNTPLWGWANYNEQCMMTTNTSTLSANPNVVAGNCPQSSPTSSTLTAGATYTATGPGCAKATADPTDIDTYNFACKYTRKYWDPCSGNANNASCFKWCYAECSLPEYIPEHPWVEPLGTRPQRYYENMNGSDTGLNFCTMDRKQFDAGF
ncbi:type II secretion system protein [Bdellovibrio sp. HCB337]|uniref:type II secretion system protein n=1 Tax=Bdellovibrio sp. HCB337 TaxID=3394358 RepID=UPI0039A64899